MGTLIGRPEASERLVCCKAYIAVILVVLLPHLFVIHPSRGPDDRAPGMQRAHGQALVLLASQGHDAGHVGLGLAVIDPVSVHDVLVAALGGTARLVCAVTAPALPARLGAANRSLSIGDALLAELFHLSVWVPVGCMGIRSRLWGLSRSGDLLAIRRQRRQPLLTRPRHGQKAGVQGRRPHGAPPRREKSQPA